MNGSKAEQLANEHWAWVVRWLEIVYKDAFIHGYKHGIKVAQEVKGEGEYEH